MSRKKYLVGQGEKISDIEKNLPYYSGWIVCVDCEIAVVSAFPESLLFLRCVKCEKFKGQFVGKEIPFELKHFEIYRSGK